MGFLGDVIIRTRPLPATSQWFTIEADDPFPTFALLYRPVSVLWNGTRLWVLLEGHPDDVADQARSASLVVCDGPPPVPTGSRWVVPPMSVAELTGEFVAEIGIGVVHHAHHVPSPAPSESSVTKLTRRIKAEFDPRGRLNPGVDVG